MPALIDDDLTLFGGRADWETEPAVSLDPAGYDTVKATLCYRGSASGLMGLLALGSQSCPDFPGLPLFYTGPRVLEARFGYQIAELTWAGIAQVPWTSAPVLATSLGTNSFVRTVNITMTTEESLWPRETTQGGTLRLGSPYAPTTNGLRTFTVIIPNASGGTSTIITQELPWRIRLIGRAWSVKMSGIVAGARSAIIKPPKCMIPDPTIMGGGTGLTKINWLSTGDPLVSYSEDAGASDGWVCRNYDTSQEQPLGGITLAKWTADYQWVERYGP